MLFRVVVRNVQCIIVDPVLPMLLTCFSLWSTKRTSAEGGATPPRPSYRELTAGGAGVKVGLRVDFDVFHPVEIVVFGQLLAQLCVPLCVQILVEVVGASVVAIRESITVVSTV